MTLKLTIDQILQQAITMHQEGKYEEAEILYRKVLEAQPTNLAANNNLGTILEQFGKLEEAETYYKKIIEINPDFAEAYNNLGSTLTKLNKFVEAEKCFKKAVQFKPDYVQAYYNLGNILQKLEKLDEAKINYKKAIELKPDYADAYNNLGNIRQILGRFDIAETNYKKAIELKPDYAEAFNNLGNLQKVSGKPEEAETSYKKAIELKPDYFEAYFNLAGLQRLIKKVEESVKNYEHALNLNPDMDYLLGSLLHTKMHLCMWDDLTHELPELIKKINDGKKVSQPFFMLSLIDEPSIHKKCAQIYSNEKYSRPDTFLKIPPYRDHKKIKIGYFSPDFSMHPVADLTAELYENHDREKFEIHAFSFAIGVEDEVTNRIKSGVDYFHDVRKMSHNDVVKLARSLEIDIAIDLAGFTSQQRTEIFSMSAAPVQASYLGYAGTLCSDFIDYAIVDQIVVPKDRKHHYSEKIVYLPNSFMSNDSKVKISNKVFKRKDVGLPVDGFVFCCFNNAYKINPITFTRWMKILSKVTESVLWLSNATSTVINNLKKEAKKNAIDENRLIFSTFLELKEDHLSRIKLADLFLDTLPFNAHATASDALCVGLPVLTYTGNAFAGRVATSLLNSVNLPEMITTSEEQYISTAIDLATNPEKLKIIKDKLINNLPTAPLFNNKLFTKNIEEAYFVMHDRNQKGSDLDDIEIDH